MDNIPKIKNRYNTVFASNFFFMRNEKINNPTKKANIPPLEKVNTRAIKKKRKKTIESILALPFLNTNKERHKNIGSSKKLAYALTISNKETILLTTRTRIDDTPT
tara:strand:- start:181 stop:498 length:318 start_codon:yes stop_codon:yes gene_type:complete